MITTAWWGKILLSFGVVSERERPILYNVQRSPSHRQPPIPMSPRAQLSLSLSLFHLLATAKQSQTLRCWNPNPTERWLRWPRGVQRDFAVEWWMYFMGLGWVQREHKCKMIFWVCLPVIDTETQKWWTALITSIYQIFVRTATFTILNFFFLLYWYF